MQDVHSKTDAAADGQPGLPPHAQVVIVGGGIVGCSIAYHLTEMGCKDVVVIEKGELTSGSTWHAAGLVGQLRSSRNITRMLQYSVDLYGRLEAETGQPTGFKAVGGLRLASSKDRMFEIKRALTMAKSFGLEMHLLSPKEAQDLFPLMSTDGVEGAAFLPTDGYADPTQLTTALSLGARHRGAKFVRQTRVLKLQLENGRVRKIVTDQGTIECETFVNAAGMWARELGQMAGVNVPLIPVEHQYLVTEVIPNIPSNLPTMRDPDNLVYYKEEAGGMVMGGYEQGPKAWSTRLVPRDFGQELLEPDFEQFEPLSERAMVRTPVLAEVGVRKLINGPEAFTPDGTFIMGRAPELKNYYVAAGFNAHGIAAGGGAGKMLAEWIIHGEPSLDLWSVDIRRFGPYHQSLSYVTERTCELYGKHYTMHWPFEEHESARGIRKSPLYSILKERGGVFGAKFGWERPNWFAPKGVEARDEMTFGRPTWMDHVANEHRAIRENVALIDQSSFSKFEVHGPDATHVLQSLAVANIDRPVGSLVYTQLANSKGGIEADLTIGRIDRDHYYIVTGTSFGVHDFNWIKDHIPEDADVQLEETTNARAVINVCGPKSRELLNRVSVHDFSLESFPFSTCQSVEIGCAQMRALRVTYVGELGWELHIPVESALSVYERLWEAGQDLGVCNAGYRAIESCRLEKGYRYWSSDLTPDYTPYEAGLGFCVNLEKGDFLGRDALVAAKSSGPRERLIGMTIEGDPMLHGGETIYHQGKVVGVLTSGGFGHTVKKTIAFGYVPNEIFKGPDFEVEVMGERYPATRFIGALYDPKRERILV